MLRVRTTSWIAGALGVALAMVALLIGTSAFAGGSHTSKPFAGIKINGGTVTHSVQNGRQVLTLSDDFKVPDTPDPHWQVVDSHGTVYLLDRLQAKNDKYNKSVVLPSYIHDVAKVQIWCAWAETLLGEAPFEKPVM